jgi:hypothetical protein
MRRTPWATVPVSLLGVLIVALLAPSLAGCGDVDAGSTPFPGTVLYAAADGSYQFNLLEPPWIPVPIGTETIFLVPPSDLTDSTDVSDALYSLHIDPVNGTPSAARAADQAAAQLTGAPGSAPPRADTLKTVSGLVVYEVSWQVAAATFERDAFLAGKSATTFRLQFSARRSIATDDMVTQMVSSFEAP